MYLRWQYIACFGWIIPTLAFLISFYCPESPVHLINKGNIDEASEVINKVNGNDAIATKGTGSFINLVAKLLLLASKI